MLFRSIEGNAKKALELNSKEPLGLFLYGARLILAPGILGNPQKGITLIEKELPMVATNTELFQLYNILAQGYARLKDYASAHKYNEICKDIYPTNYRVRDMDALLKGK